MAATMPDSGLLCKDRKVPQAVPGVTTGNTGGRPQVHVRVAVYTNGTSVGSSDASWDMQQAAKSIACGTQAKDCVRW